MESTDAGRSRWRFPAALSAQNAGALYVLFGLIVLFSIWQSDTFPRYETLTGMLADNAVAGIVALGLTLPLAAGVFDLSVGYVVGTASVFLAWLLGETGLTMVEASVLTLLVCAAIGIVNAILVVGVGIDSFIATLATGSLLQALILSISGGLNMTAGLEKTGSFLSSSVVDITVPVICMLAFTIGLWVALQHTPTGRRIYATGLNAESAHLTGVRTARLRFVSLIASAVAAGVAGIIVTQQIGAGSPSVGPPLLIPAFAAAFLGSTQFTPGRFNAFGTLLAIVLIGTINTGLALAGVPTWVPYLSTGSVLLVALAIGRLRERPRALSYLWEWVRTRGGRREALAAE